MSQLSVRQRARRSFGASGGAAEGTGRRGTPVGSDGGQNTGRARHGLAAVLDAPVTVPVDQRALEAVTMRALGSRWLHLHSELTNPPLI